MVGEPTFFEIGVEDAERGRAFYGALFGWEFAPGPSGQPGVISTRTLGGGLHGGDPRASPYLFFAVEDIDAAAARVRELGGTIEEMDVGSDDEDTVATFGRFKFCRDDQGSPFGLHQPPAGGA